MKVIRTIIALFLIILFVLLVSSCGGGGGGSSISDNINGETNDNYSNPTPQPDPDPDNDGIQNPFTENGKPIVDPNPNATWSDVLVKLSRLEGSMENDAGVMYGPDGVIAQIIELFRNYPQFARDIQDYFKFIIHDNNDLYPNWKRAWSTELLGSLAIFKEFDPTHETLVFLFDIYSNTISSGIDDGIAEKAWRGIKILFGTYRNFMYSKYLHLECVKNPNASDYNEWLKPAHRRSCNEITKYFGTYYSDTALFLDEVIRATAIESISYSLGNVDSDIFRIDSIIESLVNFLLDDTQPLIVKYSAKTLETALTSDDVDKIGKFIRALDNVSDRNFNNRRYIMRLLNKVKTLEGTRKLMAIAESEDYYLQTRNDALDYVGYAAADFAMNDQHSVLVEEVLDRLTALLSLSSSPENDSLKEHVQTAIDNIEYNQNSNTTAHS